MPTDVSNEEKSSDDLCIGCMTPIEAGADFCQKCGLPVGMHTTLDPLKSIYASGWVYRRAISKLRDGRGSPFMFWGMWMVFGPSSVITAFWLIMMLVYWNESPSPIRLIAGVAWLALQIAVLWRVTAADMHAGTRKPGHCRKCGYNLDHLTSDRCPECGQPFDHREIADELAFERDEIVPTDGGVTALPGVDLDSVSADAYPIYCDGCGASLSGMDERGECSKCGEPYDRAERLFARYGPEVFVEDRGRPETQKSGDSTFTWAVVSSCILFLYIPFSVKMRIYENHGEVGWILVIFLAVNFVLAWQRVLHSPGGRDADQTDEPD